MSVLKKLSVIIPAYNEAKTIQKILERVANVKLLGGIEKEIIIINDCSTDETEIEIIRFKTTASTNIVYLKHEVNKGKGAAIHTGIKVKNARNFQHYLRSCRALANQTV